MEHDLDHFGRDLLDRLRRLLGEVNRLAAENERLLRENKELREEVTLARLQGEFKGDGELPSELVSSRPPEETLSADALAFYRKLPEKINFTDFFRHAEAEAVDGARARELMLLFFRKGLLDQRGRRLEKRRTTPVAREVHGV